MDKILRYAAYAGVVGLILMIPLVGLELMTMVAPLTGYLLPAYIITNAVNSLLSIMVCWGFKIIGEKTKNKLLEMTSLAVIAFIFLSTGYSLVNAFIHLDAMTHLIAGAVMLVVLGVLNIAFGVALLKLKDKFGDLATATGVVEIITGVAAVTIILSPISLVTSLIVAVLEVVLLWKASDTL